MLTRIYQRIPLDDPPKGARSILSYSQFDLAILSLCAQAIAYYVRTGFWPKLAPHDTTYLGVWP
jgi:hypothetical protein